MAAPDASSAYVNLSGAGGSATAGGTASSAGGSAAAGVQAAVETAATDAARSQLTQQAANAGRTVVRELRGYYAANHWSVRALSFSGGVALIIIAILGILNVFAVISGPMRYILHAYELMLGLIIVAIDGPSERLSRVNGFLEREAHFLYTPFGRAWIKLFISGIEGSQAPYELLNTHTLCGIYFMVVGVAFIMETYCKPRNPSPAEATEGLAREGVAGTV